jgi:hypothetical protein
MGGAAGARREPRRTMITSPGHVPSGGPARIQEPDRAKARIRPERPTERGWGKAAEGGGPGGGAEKIDMSNKKERILKSTAKPEAKSKER